MKNEKEPVIAPQSAIPMLIDSNAKLMKYRFIPYEQFMYITFLIKASNAKILNLHSIEIAY